MRPPLEPERFGARGGVGGPHPCCPLVLTSVSHQSLAVSSLVFLGVLSVTCVSRLAQVGVTEKGARTQLAANMVAERCLTAMADLQRAGGQPAELPAEKQNRRAVWCVFTSGEQEDDETEANKQQAASAREYDDKLEGE